MSTAGFFAACSAALSLLLCAGSGGAAVSGQPVEVPSGQPMALTEVLVDDSPGEVWVRFRFVAPRIAREGGDVPYETAAADMDHLCQALVLPYLVQYQLAAARVIVSLADRDVPFGATDPEATQFFQSYRPDGDSCIWEEY